MYSEPSLRRTPSGSALAVRLKLRVSLQKNKRNLIRSGPANHVRLREVSALQWCPLRDFSNPPFLKIPDNSNCNFTPDISNSRFLEPIFVSLGGSRNRDSTVDTTNVREAFITNQCFAPQFRLSSEERIEERKPLRPGVSFFKTILQD